MADGPKLTATISLPENFKITEVAPRPLGAPAPPPPPPVPALGPLAAFVGNWHGNGFNTIFRPNNPVTPTVLPTGPVVGDNVLELNLTSESLSFSPSLGAVPNRGMVQGDVFLNGVPYLQAIADITDPLAKPTGIHLEPGLWVVVPATTNPAEPASVARMASIPHGTTINAQGTFATTAGPPVIPPVSITPSFIVGNQPITFPSQTATATGTARIPQDLNKVPITQAMLDDPNSVLRAAIAHQTIVSTTTLTISTTPATPLIGGGTDNVAFLKPNADAVQMTAVFWIETVEHSIIIPIHTPGQPVHVKPHGPAALPLPTFEITPPHGIAAGHVIKVHAPQIQYTQTVFLNFNGLRWPHVSVATLVPTSAIPIPWP